MISSEDVGGTEPAIGRRRWPRSLVVESLAVLASPVIAFFALRLRPMAPYHISDPALDTAYIFHPADFVARYSVVLRATAGLREGARVGFLVPARLSYLAFGALPGFFVTRFVFALIAVVPAYMLLRRLYGRAAGVLAVIVVLSCPVIITAWGSDYSDSAMDSYLLGALACLAMPCSERRRPVWLAIGGALLTMAVWSHFEAVPLAGVTVVVYVLVWLRREPRRVIRDLAVLAGSFLVVTGLLSVGSELLLGHFDFIRPTWDAYRYLSQPHQVRADHSSSWRFVLYLTYLLVPPAVVGAWAVAFAGRFRATLTSQALVGLVCAGQVLSFAFLQFVSNGQTLELFYLSSALWGAVCVTLAVTIAELARPLLSRHVARWVPALVLLAVPLCYEVSPQLSAIGWRLSAMLAGAAVIVAAAGRWVTTKQVTKAVLAGSTLTVAAVTGLVLVLTVAPVREPSHIPGVLGHPKPNYGAALGGSPYRAVEAYQISSEVPAFVGNASYPGELLFTWWANRQGAAILPSAGIYHASATSILSVPPHITARNLRTLDQYRPAQLLVLCTDDVPVNGLLRALSGYQPSFVRSTVLTSGSLRVHAWLLSLGTFARQPT